MNDSQFELHAQIEQRHWWFTARREIIRRLIAMLVPPGEGKQVVDIGCGTGANIASLANGYRCTGIDVSARATELARQRFPDTEFVCGVAPEAVRRQIEAASLVTIMDVLEHVADDFELLSKLLNASCPGTYFIVTVPADQRLWSPHDEHLGHYRRYDFDRLKSTWLGLPVTCLMLSYFNARLYPAIRLMRLLTSWAKTTAGSAGTDLRLPSAPMNRLLHRMFAGEAESLCHALESGGGPAYKRGVSLIAVLRREEGELLARKRPASIAADFFLPTVRPAGSHFNDPTTR